MRVIDGEQSDGEFHGSARREHEEEDIDAALQVKMQRSRNRKSMHDTIPDLVEEEFLSGNGKPGVHYELSEVRGLKTSEVFAVLKRLFGDPVSIHGSHYKWKVNGRTYPLPMHDGRDVPPGCLKDFLEGLEIPRDAFLPQIHGKKKGSKAPHGCVQKIS
jgi:predicted RNA binding protein YcfA (HicA-like mRNA interferase family)